MKLTKTQEDLLTNVASGGRMVAGHYPPAKKLVALGLCDWNTGRTGSTWLTITDAGRAALKENAK